MRVRYLIRAHKVQGEKYEWIRVWAKVWGDFGGEKKIVSGKTILYHHKPSDRSKHGKLVTKKNNAADNNDENGRIADRILKG